MKHGGSVNGALFSPDESRILSWRGDNLFEIACNHMPQTHDLARLSRRYGVQIADPICAAPNKIPIPDWKKVERAPR
jgi:hypothetical protein